jgi:hypothetical protein
MVCARAPGVVVDKFYSMPASRDSQSGRSFRPGPTKFELVINLKTAKAPGSFVDRKYIRLQSGIRAKADVGRRI